MKRLTIIGNIGMDSIVKDSQDGNQFVVSSVAVKIGTKDNPKVEWVELIFNDNLVDFANKYIVKGTKVFIEGFPSINVYPSKTGELVAKQRIYVNKVELLSSKSKNTLEDTELSCDEYVDLVTTDDIGKASDEIPNF